MHRHSKLLMKHWKRLLDYVYEFADGDKRGPEGADVRAALSALLTDLTKLEQQFDPSGRSRQRRCVHPGRESVVTVSQSRGQ